jgi:uncharacterized protein YjbI with pentapeptide repeats
MTRVFSFFSEIYDLIPSLHLLIGLGGVLIVAALLLYFWGWYSLPRYQVPIHLSPQELKVLEVQDQLRKTQIQIPIVVALVATFILVLIQFGINSRQWTTDSELRSTQTQMNQFSEAVNGLAGQNMESHVAGIYAMQYLVGIDTDRNIRRVNEMLASTVRSHATEEKLRHSIECNGPGKDASGKDWPQDREEAAEDLQAALTVLGNKLYAGHFNQEYDPRAKQCVGKDDDLKRTTQLADAPTLEHRFLDDLNLGATDFSCAHFSASRFRRTSFEYANLQGADFRAAIFENRELLGLNEDVENYRKQYPAKNVAEWLHTNSEVSWKRYRCWSVFFKNAFLDGARFDHAQLAGAVFESASLNDAVFDQANITLADFRGSTVTAAQLDKACVWGDGQPLLDDKLAKELGHKIAECQWDGK